MSGTKRFFVDRRLCMGCRTCELQCAVNRGSTSKNLIAALREEILPRNRVYVHSDNGEPVTLHCRQCEDAPCLSVCSTGALQLDYETGVKFIDGEKCINYAAYAIADLITDADRSEENIIPGAFDPLSLIHI